MLAELSPKQVKAVAKLASGMRSKEVAADLKVSAQTVSEWKSIPHFQAELNKLKWEALHEARDMIQASAELAVRNLIEIASNSESDSVRRQACNDLIALTGLSNPAGGLYGWGVGHESVEKIIEQEMMDGAMSAMFSSRIPTQNHFPDGLVD